MELHVVVYLHQPRKNHLDGTDGCAIMSKRGVKRIEIRNADLRNRVDLFIGWRFYQIFLPSEDVASGKKQQGEETEQWRKKPYEIFLLLRKHKSHSFKNYIHYSFFRIWNEWKRNRAAG